MRCSEVIRELAVPGLGSDADALAAHLAACRTCAAWARQAKALDRLWQATSPAPPSSETWNSMWDEVQDVLAAGAQVAEISQRSRSSAPGSAKRSRLLQISLIALAQAAAVLLVVGLSWRSAVHHEPSLSQTNRAQAIAAQTQTSDPLVEIDEGPVVIITVDGDFRQVTSLSANSLAWGVDDWFILFNELESLASTPVVAMQE